MLHQSTDGNKHVNKVGFKLKKSFMRNEMHLIYLLDFDGTHNAFCITLNVNIANSIGVPLMYCIGSTGLKIHLMY